MTATSLIGIYPGTFDPVTNGHIDIIARATKIVDRLVIAVAANIGKDPMFSLEERTEIVRGEIEFMDDGMRGRIEVRPFDTLLMSFAQEMGASCIIRGLRAVSDFEYEFAMTGMNARLDPEIETVFLMASDRNQIISSMFVKEIACLHGDISSFVSPRVAERVLTQVVQKKSATGGGK